MVKFVALAKSLMAEDMLVVTRRDSTVLSVKQAVHQNLDIPVDHLVLISRGKPMKNDAPLSEHLPAVFGGELVVHLLFRPTNTQAVGTDVAATAVGAANAEMASPLIVKVVAISKSVMAEELFVITCAHSTALSVKLAIRHRLSISVKNLLLVSRGKSIHDDEQLIDYRTKPEGVLVFHLLHHTIKAQPEIKAKAVSAIASRSASAAAAAQRPADSGSASARTTTTASASLGSRWKTFATSHDEEASLGELSGARSSKE